MMYTQYEPDTTTVLSWNNVYLTLHLFFLRIMKEHCIFLEAGFSRAAEGHIQQVRELHKGFESLLAQAVRLANGIVSKRTLESQQFITPYTVQAERLTSFFTGIPINSAITEREKAIVPLGVLVETAGADQAIGMLNDNARKLTKQLADFKKKTLTDVLHCRIFTALYPTELEHVYKEAEHYLKNLDELEKDKNPVHHGNLKEELEFWNEIMAEHNKAMAGRLDPTEEKLIEQSRMFAKEFDALSADTKKPTASMQVEREKSLDAVRKLQGFQIETTKGVMDCSIQSIVYPLRVDHHIRETAHFEFILEAGKRPM
ncbi:MAG: DUF2935 domain-containing protein [Eubacteriales bacterium]